MKEKSRLIATISAVLLACAAISQAQMLPDDPGYRASRQNETAELRAAESSMEKAELSLLHAQRRFAEVRRAIEEEKLSFVNELLRGYNGSLQQVLSEVSREIARGTNVSEIYTSLQQTLAGHIPVLTGLADDAPRETRSALRQATDTARKAHDMASNWLERQALIDAGQIAPGTRFTPPSTTTPDRAPGGVPGGRVR